MESKKGAHLHDYAPHPKWSTHHYCKVCGFAIPNRFLPYTPVPRKATGGKAGRGEETMEKQLTPEQFRAQFPVGPVTFRDFQPVYSKTLFGYEIYRALQILVLKDPKDGQFYVAKCC